MKQETILIVDDDPKMIKLLKANLQARDYLVIIALDGDEALEAIEKNLPDLVILDILMPKLDGREVCRRLREWSPVPIIVLSALGEAGDKVKCLNLGADDYITKPFSIDELLARIRVVLRRGQKNSYEIAQPSVKIGKLEVDLNQRLVTLAGNTIKLTATEYNLLQELALNAGKVLTHAYLLQKVWGPEYQQENEYLRVYISRLRAKLEPQPDNPDYILTVPGIGYQFKKAG